MATVLIDTLVTSVYELPRTAYHPLGTYITIQDNGSNPGFFASNSITIKTSSGETFYDGKLSDSIETSGGYATFTAMSKSWRRMNTFAYVTSGNGIQSNISTTNLFSRGTMSLSNLTVHASFTVSEGMDVQDAPTIQGIPCVNSGDLLSTVNGLGSIGFLSSIPLMNIAVTSTFVGLGGYGYISTPQLQSTIVGLGQSYISTSWLTSTFEGLGSLYLSTPSIRSTVGGLGTYYISTASLSSTLEGLGTVGYISTAHLTSTISNVYQITSSNNESTVTKLGYIYISSASLVSTVIGLSNTYIVTSNLTSTASGLSGNYRPATESTIAGLAHIGYISSLSLFSTVESIVLSSQSNVSAKLSSIGSNYISSLSLYSTVNGLGELYISTIQLTSTTTGLSNATSADLASTVIGLGNLYHSTGHLVSTTSGISDVVALTIASTVDGLGSSYISSLGLQSTVAGLGTSKYISLSQLTSTSSNLQTSTSNAITSTILGLGNLNYISLAQLTSTVGSLNSINTSNLISTVNTLGYSDAGYPAYISSLSLQSTVGGLGTAEYISLSQLTSTTSNVQTSASNAITSTILGLGNLNYISLAQLTSTVGSLNSINTSNLISTVNILGFSAAGYPAYISSLSLQSTVGGLGTLQYISLSQLTSTTSNLQTSASNAITSTILGLGNLKYISLAQLTSTVDSLNSINTSNLISTVNTLGFFAAGYPAYISSLSLQSTVGGLGTLQYISLSQLTSTTSNLQTSASNAIASTILGLGNLKYISLAQLTSTVDSLTTINTSNLISTVNTLGFFAAGYPAYISSLSLQSTVGGLGTLKYISLSQLTSTTSNLESAGPGQITSTIIGLGNLKYISKTQLMSTVTGFSNNYLSNLVSTVDRLGDLPIAYVSPATLQTTATGWSNSYITNTQIQNQYITDQTSVGNIFDSTVVGLGTLTYISLAHVTSTVTGLGTLNTSNLISTVNMLGFSGAGFPAYISSASLVSTVDGVNVKLLNLSNLTSTTSNVQLGLYGTTSTFDGLGTSKYISISQITSTVTWFSNTNQSNLVSMVNSLGSSGYISSLSLQSTVAGLGTAGYISLAQLTSTTTGLIPNTEYTGLTITSGLKLWLDGADPNGTGVPPAIGETITSWKDKSLTGVAAVPSFSYATYSSQGIVFNGTGGYKTSTLGFLQKQTVFIVFYPSASSFTGSQTLVGQNLEAAAGVEVVQYKLNGNSKIRIDKSRNVTDPFQLFDIPSLPANTPYLLSSTVDLGLGATDEINVYLNGIASSSGSLKLPELNGSGNTYSIGFTNNNNFAAENTYTGTISEVLIYDNILSTAQRQSVEQYLAQKWAIYTPLPPPFISSANGLAGILPNTSAYISSLTFQSNVANLGSLPYSYMSTPSLVSTVNGLGTMYLSTPYLRSTTAGLRIPSNTFTSTTAGLGQIYISTSALKSIAPDTYTVTTFSPYIGVPYALACTSNFIFYGGGGTIYKNTFSGQSQTIFKTSAATLITALACDLSNVYVVADNVNYILSINIQTENVTFLVNSTNASGYNDSSDPTLVRFNTINDICMDPTYRYLYICDAGNKRLRRLQFSPFNVTTLVMIDANIQSLAIDSRSEYIYVTYIDSGNNSFIYRHSLLGFSRRLYSTDISSLGLISGISIDTSQNFAYLVPKDLHSVFRINLTSGEYSIFVGNQRGYQDGIGISAKFDNPWGCLYNPYDSCVYIADQSNGYIRKFTTLTYTSTIFGLNTVRGVNTVSASNSTLINPVTSNFVTSSYGLPLGGYRLWLDGADPNATGIVPALGTSIVRWRDKSGNGYDGVGTGTYSNGITFSGTPSQTGYASSLPTNIANQTVFTVFNPTTTNYQYIIGTTGSNSGIQVGINGTMQIDMSYPANTLQAYKRQIVQTLAGKYLQSGSDDGTGSNARFFLPEGIAIDSSGNIYVSDVGNHRIRKVTQSGVVTTYAGSTGGFQDGTGVSAQFNTPKGIAIDSSGNLYVADSLNYKIRKIDTSRNVTTYAGTGISGINNGLGNSATFTNITSITIDTSGNLYVSEYDNNIIRKIDTSQRVTTFAGNGEAGSINWTGLASTFNRPFKITCDTTNNILYVFTFTDRLIRRITIPPAYTNIPLVDTGSGYIGLLAIAMNTATGDIYFTTRSGGRNIYEYNPNSTPKARIYVTSPETNSALYGLTFTLGNLYVSDAFQCVIYKVVNRTLVRIAGIPGSPGGENGNGLSARFRLPTFLSSFYSLVYVVDSTNNIVRRIDTSDPNFPVTTVFSLMNINCMVINYDASRIYVSTPTTIYYYDTSTSTATTFVGSSSTGTTDGYGTSASFTYINNMVADDFGNVYVVDSNKSVRIISPNGYVQTVVSSFNSPINTNLSEGIYVGTNIAGVSGQSILFGYSAGYDATIFPLSQVTTLAGTGSSGSADGQGTAASFNNVYGLAVDVSGNIYAADTGGHRIRKITSGGLVTTLAGSTAGSNDGPLSSAQFNSPSGIAIYSGNIYISDYSGRTIRSIIYVGDIVNGGMILPNANTLFTSVVQRGITDGAIGYLNGTQVSQGSITNTFIDAATAHIGYTTYKTTSPYTSNFFIGRIQEIIVYNTILTTPQRESVETYLRNKWIPSLASKSITTTPNIYLSNFSTILSQNLYASNITAATFTATGGRVSGTPNRGFYYGDGTYVTSISDSRLKDSIRPIEHALEKVSSLQAVTYRMYRDPSHSWIGYIAQDLEVILPDIVRTDDSLEQWKSIQYTNLPALIIEAVKELNEKYERIKHLLSTV